MLQWVEELDHGLSRRLGGRVFPGRFATVMRWFVRLGDGWFWVPVLAGVVATRSLGQAKSIVAHCLVALGISLAVYWPVKWYVRRQRPYQRIPGISAGVPPLDRFSFPSGHTMHNLAVGLTVAHYFPPVGWVLAAAPFVWGLMRVHFGVHFASDVVAGGILGSGSFLLGLWLFGS